ncbi:hypothetical protein KUTeg_017694, partial [Tegillarca granosa]
MAYNVITPLCILKLMERSQKKISPTITYICVILFVMGASIHLVGDSVSHRLVLLGYQFHMSIRDNPMMQQLKPEGLVESFELLYLYDEIIGHLMCNTFLSKCVKYIAYFACLLLYYAGCFQDRLFYTDTSRSILLSPFSKKKAYLFSLVILFKFVTMVTYFIEDTFYFAEGQVFYVFGISFVAMIIITIKEYRKGHRLDRNGQFLLYTFSITLILIMCWVVYLWNDPILRKKYPGYLYLPEPWTYYTLYKNQMR